MEKASPPNVEQPEWVDRLLVHVFREFIPFLGEDDDLVFPPDPFRLGRSLGYSLWYLHLAKTASVGHSTLEKYIEGKYGEIKEVITSFCDRPLSEAEQFFRGLAEGAPGPLTKGGLKHSPPYVKLYMELILNWREVERMKSRTALHQWLCKKLGISRVPNPDSFQKICQKMGIKLASRGRPKK